MIPSPWCDQCGEPAVWSESQGWCHWKKGYGSIWPAEDKSGHVVTCRGYVQLWSEGLEF